MSVKKPIPFRGPEFNPETNEPNYNYKKRSNRHQDLFAEKKYCGPLEIMIVEYIESKTYGAFPPRVWVIVTRTELMKKFNRTAEAVDTALAGIVEAGFVEVKTIAGGKTRGTKVYRCSKLDNVKLRESKKPIEVPHQPKVAIPIGEAMNIMPGRSSRPIQFSSKEGVDSPPLKLYNHLKQRFAFKLVANDDGGYEVHILQKSTSPQKTEEADPVGLGNNFSVSSPIELGYVVEDEGNLRFERQIGVCDPEPGRNLHPDNLDSDTETTVPISLERETALQEAAFGSHASTVETQRHLDPRRAGTGAGSKSHTDGAALHGAGGATPPTSQPGRCSARTLDADEYDPLVRESAHCPEDTQEAGGTGRDQVEDGRRGPVVADRPGELGIRGATLQRGDRLEEEPPLGLTLAEYRDFLRPLMLERWSKDIDERFLLTIVSKAKRAPIAVYAELVRAKLAADTDRKLRTGILIVLAEDAARAHRALQLVPAPPQRPQPIPMTEEQRARLEDMPVDKYEELIRVDPDLSEWRKHNA